MSHRRPGRVADHVKQVLARLLREEIRDPRVGFVTLTDVELSADLRVARVFVSVLEADHDEALEALRHASSFLRRSLARETRLKHTPELRFEIDESVAGGFEIDRILDDLHRDRPALPEGGSDPGPATDPEES